MGLKTALPLIVFYFHWSPSLIYHYLKKIKHTDIIQKLSKEKQWARPTTLLSA